MNEYFFSYKETYIYPDNNKNVKQDVIDNYINDRITNCKTVQDKYLLASFDKDEILLKYSDPYYTLTNLNQHIFNNIYQNRLSTDIILANPPQFFDYNYNWCNYILGANIDKNKKMCIIDKRVALYYLFEAAGFVCDVYIDNEINKGLSSGVLHFESNLSKSTFTEAKNFNHKKLDTMYDCIIYNNIVSKYHIINDNNMLLQINKQREYINCMSLQYMYNILDNLNVGGDLIFYYPLISNNCSLLLIESVIQCFESVSLMSDKLIEFIWGNAYICKNFKGKLKMLKKNTTGFYNFIMKVSKVNDKNNKNILLTRLGVDVVLKYFPQSLELENKYLLNKHNALLLIKKLKLEKLHIKQQEKDIRKYIVLWIKKMFEQKKDITIKINIPCTLKNNSNRNNICIGDYTGIFYDININTPNKKYVKDLTRHNKLFYSRKQTMMKHPTYNEYKQYLETKSDFFNVFSNIEIDITKNKIFIHVNNTVKGIKRWLKFNNHIGYTHNEITIKTKCSDIINKWIVMEGNIHNILYAIHNMNTGDGLIMHLKLPINKKVIWDLLYIVYCSFKVIYLDMHNETIYMVCEEFKKNISTEKLIQANIEDKLSEDISIIVEPYTTTFINTFGGAINCYVFMLILRFEILTHILTQNISL